MTWSIFVRSSECDSRWLDSFEGNEQQAFDEFFSQHPDAAINDSNGYPFAVERDGDRWWEYQLVCVAE